jgi:hypothetical protein
MAQLKATTVNGDLTLETGGKIVNSTDGTVEIQDTNIKLSGNTEFTGSITSSDATTGQSTINKGLVVNNNGGSESTDDFEVKGDTKSVLKVDADIDTLITTGGRKVDYILITGTQAIPVTDTIIYLNGSSITGTLPDGSANSLNGLIYTIINIHSTSATINTNSQNVNGSSSNITLAQYATLKIQYLSGTDEWIKLQ